MLLFIEPISLGMEAWEFSGLCVKHLTDNMEREAAWISQRRHPRSGPQDLQPVQEIENAIRYFNISLMENVKLNYFVSWTVCPRISNIFVNRPIQYPSKRPMQYPSFNPMLMYKREFKRQSSSQVERLGSSHYLAIACESGQRPGSTYTCFDIYYYLTWHAKIL